MWHSCAPWSPSGYGTQTAIWMQELVKMGHEVICSSYWGLSGSPTSWNNITVLPGFGNNYCTPSLHQHAQRVNPDLIITLGDIWVMDAALLRELPVAHWLPSDCRPMSLADRANVEASGAELIAMSRFGYDRFKEAGFNPVYVPHGIDMSTFRPPADKAEVRREMGVDPDAFVIGINGANNDAIRKSYPEQMLAFAKFAGKHPDALLALHASVHQEGGQDLEALAENLGITDRVRCVDQYRYASGLVQPGEIGDWYGMLDLLSCCSFGEGFGIPIIEAQACGTPVLTTDASSMPELNPLGMSVRGEPFWNGVHKGWWAKPLVSEIAAAYEKAYDSRENVPRDALREFAGEYSVEKVAERFMKPAVEELLGRMEKRKV